MLGGVPLSLQEHGLHGVRSPVEQRLIIGVHDDRHQDACVAWAATVIGTDRDRKAVRETVNVHVEEVRAQDVSLRDAKLDRDGLGQVRA